MGTNKVASCENPGIYAEGDNMPLDRVVSALDASNVDRSVAGVEDDFICEFGRESAVVVVCGGMMGACIGSIDSGF